MYTKGEWKASKSVLGDWAIISGDALICREVRHFNAQLISKAPQLYEIVKYAFLCITEPETHKLEAIKDAMELILAEGK